MNHEKYLSSEPENADNSMEWEGDEGINACSGEDAISSFGPNAASGYAFSQPSTSGYTGRKRKSSSSPPPSKISRKTWDGKQQHSLNIPNPHNNSEVVSGFAIAPPLPQMMQQEQRGIASQATSDNAAVLVNDDTSNSERDISTDFLPESGAVLNPNRNFRSVAELKRDREHIIRFLDIEGSSLDTEDPPVEEETQPSTGRYSFFHRRVELLSSTFDLPERYRKALRRHLHYHRMDEMSLPVLRHSLPARTENASLKTGSAMAPMTAETTRTRSTAM